MTDNLICGIDIGSSKIATVVGMDSAETDELKIIGFNTTLAKRSTERISRRYKRGNRSS